MDFEIVVIHNYIIGTFIVLCRLSLKFSYIHEKSSKVKTENTKYIKYNTLLTFF